MTLGIVLGPGSGAHAGDRTLDVEAPGFRGATLGGALLALAAIGFVWYLLSSRRRARASARATNGPSRKWTSKPASTYDAVVAALLGFPVAFAAVLFQTAIHDVIHFVWEVVPHWLDWSEPAWWYVILVPAFAGVLVALFLRLPGHGGHSPLEGV